MDSPEILGQDQVIAAALAAGATHRAAAEVAGVSERTVRRRLEFEEFQAEVESQRGEIIRRTTDRLTGLTTTAVDALAELLSSEETPPAVRLRTALGILTTQRVWREAGEIEDRISQLEHEHAMVVALQEEA